MKPKHYLYAAVFIFGISVAFVVKGVQAGKKKYSEEEVKELREIARQTGRVEEYQRWTNFLVDSGNTRVDGIIILHKIPQQP